MEQVIMIYESVDGMWSNGILDMLLHMVSYSVRVLYDVQFTVYTVHCTLYSV